MLYVAVADMVVKPSSSDTGTLSTGGGIIVLALIAAVATALRSSPPGSGLSVSLASTTESELRRAA